MENNNIQQIIGYLQNHLSPEETNQFYLWLNANEENKKIYFDIKNIYDTCKYTGLNIDESWKRLLSKKQHKKTQLLWRKIASYTAVAIISIVLTSTVFKLIPQGESISSTTYQYVSKNGLEADKIILPDGTTISVGNNTLLYYENNYGTENRIVHLEGEAFFDVVTDKEKPFIVKTGEQEVEALGTKFNVTAYPGDSLFTTTLLEGLICQKNANTSQSTLLEPNQQLIYNRNTQNVSVKPVDAQQISSWTLGYYYFDDQELGTILQRLGQFYDVEFELKSEKLTKLKFNGTFYRGQSIKEILEVIKISIPIRYTIEEHCIQIQL